MSTQPAVDPVALPRWWGCPTCAVHWHGQPVCWSCGTSNADRLTINDRPRPGEFTSIIIRPDWSNSP